MQRREITGLDQTINYMCCKPLSAKDRSLANSNEVHLISDNCKWKIGTFSQILGNF